MPRNNGRRIAPSTEERLEGIVRPDFGRTESGVLAIIRQMEEYRYCWLPGVGGAYVRRLVSCQVIPDAETRDPGLVAHIAEEDEDGLSGP